MKWDVLTLRCLFRGTGAAKKVKKQAKNEDAWLRMWRDNVGREGERDRLVRKKCK